ncbi:hypothetical protein [Streptomyces sp. NPDC055107]
MLIDFLLHDVLGNLAAGLLTTATTYALAPLRQRLRRITETPSTGENEPQTPDTLGFSKGGVDVAGDLHSTLSDPSRTITASGLTPTGQPVRCEVNVRWDSAKNS